MKIGDYIAQFRNDATVYGRIVKELKNGAFQAITIDTYFKKAGLHSTNYWNPAPVIIDKSTIPEKLLNKILNH